MGKRKKTSAEAESKGVSLADKKPKTRVDAAKSRPEGTQENSRDARRTAKDKDKGDTSTSRASPPTTGAQVSSPQPSSSSLIATKAPASPDSNMSGDRQISGSKAGIALPKLLPRSLMATGLVPRQVVRSKVASAVGNRVIKMSSNGSSAASGISKSGTSASSATGSPSPMIASVTESKTIFRAKDIIKQWVPAPPDSQSPPSKAKQGGRSGTGPVRLRMFERDQDGSSEAITSTRTTKSDTWTVTSMKDQSGAKLSGHMSATRTTTTTSDTIIHAQPIVVYLERRPHRKEYPHGNYPYYYEKRVEEQSTKKAESISSSSTAAAAGSQSAREQQKQQQQRFWITKSSVLFPRRSNPDEERMSLQELAKKVDLRLEFLDPSWFRGKRVLDIGCNAALLTVFIAMHYKPRKIQGVDIDPSLIGKAQNFVLKTFSQISPQAYTQTRGDSGNNESSTVDIPYEEYFPKSMHRIHGFLPVPKRTLRTEVLFPHNIELRVADWVTETEDQQDIGAEQWDVILGFSLAKWVHLHHGDAGMKRFFQKIYRSLAPGGIFLLEPQAFETYNRRSKLTPVMQENYKAMTFKPQNFQEYLLSDEVGFRQAIHLGHSEGGAKNFNRDIFLYRK